MPVLLHSWVRFKAISSKQSSTKLSACQMTSLQESAFRIFLFGHQLEQFLEHDSVDEPLMCLKSQRKSGDASSQAGHIWRVGG